MTHNIGLHDTREAKFLGLGGTLAPAQILLGKAFQAEKENRRWLLPRAREEKNESSLST